MNSLSYRKNTLILFVLFNDWPANRLLLRYNLLTTDRARILAASQSIQSIFLALDRPLDLHNPPAPPRVPVHDLYHQLAENNIDQKDAVYVIDHTTTGLKVVYYSHIGSRKLEGYLLAIKNQTNRI